MADKNFKLDLANSTCSNNGMAYLQNKENVTIYNPLN